jgi:hypothetical protein
VANRLTQGEQGFYVVHDPDIRYAFFYISGDLFIFVVAEDGGLGEQGSEVASLMPPC